MVRNKWKMVSSEVDNIDGLVRKTEVYIGYDYKNDKPTSGKRTDIYYRTSSGVVIGYISKYSRKSLGPGDHNVLYLSTKLLHHPEYAEVIAKVRKLNPTAKESEFMSA